MKRFLITFAAVIAAQIVLAGMAVLLAVSMVSFAMMGRTAGQAQVPQQGYLIQEIPSELPEFVPECDLPFPRRATSLTDILENLEKARHDERIAGVVLKLGVPQIGWGMLQELRVAVERLRESGKPVLAHTTFAGNSALYLGAACDSIYLDPGGYVFLTGFNAERFYARELLDRLGVRMQVSRIKEYKSMAEMVQRTDMSPEVRANVTQLLEDLYDAFMDELARGRGVARSQAAAWAETAQFDADGAHAAGLIDGVFFWEDLVARLSTAAGDDWSIDGRDYAGISRASVGLRGESIAVIHGSGTITQGESGWIAPLGTTMGDETMVAALREALEDDGIAGILLRLDTGGGLSVASDRIGRMVGEVARHKPVVVSMVNMTASGGYMVSYRCSTLVALPNSVVGSIGSISMNGNMTDMLGKIGITVDRVTVGPHATALSSLADQTPEEFARFESLHWNSYQAWVAGIARHRGMTLDEVDALARGRVFTGRQALVNGLIDATGGFDEALARLKEQAGIASREAVSYVHLPRQKSLLERLAAGEIGGLLSELSGTRPVDAAWKQSLAFWERCLEGDDDLALCWWRI